MSLKRIALTDNYVPRHCGSATFTTNLSQAVAKRKVYRAFFLMRTYFFSI
jgi:hypothetical protein